MSRSYDIAKLPLIDSVVETSKQGREWVYRLKYYSVDRVYLLEQWLLAHPVNGAQKVEYSCYEPIDRQQWISILTREAVQFYQ